MTSQIMGWIPQGFRPVRCLKFHARANASPANTRKATRYPGLKKNSLAVATPIA